MAQKEALVIILDVGTSMARRGVGTAEETKQAVLKVVQNKIQFSPRDEVGLVLMGTKETRNYMADKFAGEYQHLTIHLPLSAPTLSNFRSIAAIDPFGINSSNNNVVGDGMSSSRVCCSGGGPADFLDAIILASDMLHKRTEGRKVSRRVLLITDAGDELHNKDDLKTVTVALEVAQVVLTIIGIDFNEDIASHSEEPLRVDTQDSIKRGNEKVLRFICDEVGGYIVPSHTEALQHLDALRTKSVGQVATFRGNFYVGENLTIPLVGYIKTRQTPNTITMKKQSKRGKAVADAVPGTTPTVSRDVRYFLADDPDVEIDAEKRIKAYRYGSDLIPFDGVDKAALKFKSERGMWLLGFTPSASVPRDYFMGQTYVFSVLPGDSVTLNGLSALIHAMHETDRVAIVRYVRVANAEPQLGVLIPKIKADTEFFYYHQLPFAEDVRNYPFRSNRDCKISAAQLKAAHDLIVALDLDHAERSASGSLVEALKPKQVFNPVLQHMYQCIRVRAISSSPGNGESSSQAVELPPLDPVIERYIRPWIEKGVLREMLDKAEPQIKATQSVFPLTVAKDRLGEHGKPRYWLAADVPDVNLESYKVGDKRPLEAIEGAYNEVANLEKGVDLEPADKRLHVGSGDWRPLFGSSHGGDSSSGAGLSDGSLLPVLPLIGATATTHHSGQVTTVNPVKEFNDMINRRDEDLVEKAIDQMVTVIFSLLNESIQEQYYDKAVACIQALRQGCIREEESEKFNAFMHQLRTKFGLPTQRHHAFWDKCIKGKSISLIHSDESADVDVSSQEAREFLQNVPVASVEPVVRESLHDDEEDLFGELEG